MLYIALILTALTWLPLSGSEPVIVEEDGLNAEETRVITLLLEGDRRAYTHSRSISNSWVTYFRHRFVNDVNTHVAAFLAVWLDQHVFPSSFCDPERGISRRVFPIAARLACGSQLALGAAYLGSLYLRLDQFSLDLQRSYGRFEVVSMVDITLLQVLLWEYFPSLASFFKDGTGILTREQHPR